MLINKNVHGYSRKKRHIMGRGFVDIMSSVFNSLKSAVGPTVRNINSFVSANKDLIAKPVLGAIGSLAATGLTTGVPTLIRHIANRNKSRASDSRVAGVDPQILDDPKYKEILQSMMPSQPLTNIIGSGVKRRGAG